MKKLIVILLTLTMVVSLIGCGAKTSSDTSSAAVANTDSAYVIGKGKLVVGITDFEPMDYKDASGKWIGFDADMATAFAKSLGVEVEFVEIEWDYKATELQNKNIDCVWNGMTLTDEVKASMDCSVAYCDNAQVVVVPSDKAADYNTADACKELKFAVENGSAGMEQAEAYGFTFTPVLTQADSLMEVASGSSDAAIIDNLMAAAMVGEGTSYANLTYTCALNSEQYGVGFRQGSDLPEKLNAFFKAAYADGSMKSCADTYGVTAMLIAQ